MNPTYGRTITAWIEKLCNTYEAGAVEEAIALLPSRLDGSEILVVADHDPTSYDPTSTEALAQLLFDAWDLVRRRSWRTPILGDV